MIINALSQDWTVKWLAVTGALIVFAFGMCTLIRELSVVLPSFSPSYSIIQSAKP